MVVYGVTKSEWLKDRDISIVRLGQSFRVIATRILNSVIFITTTRTKWNSQSADPLTGGVGGYMRQIQPDSLQPDILAEIVVSCYHAGKACSDAHENTEPSLWFVNA